MKLATIHQRAADLMSRMENAVSLRAHAFLDDLEKTVVQLESGFYTPAPKDASPAQPPAGATSA